MSPRHTITVSARQALAAGALFMAGCASMQPATDLAESAPVPVVIAHRGASGWLPEHTLAAYALAIEQGADFIEPDLVVTRDRVLIARHENALSGSTDVAAHPEFTARRTTKRIDGVAVTDWFAEDFSLAEIKTLRARTPWPALRPQAARHDGDFEIPTFAEVIALAGAHPRVGIYPETKHPTFFADEGRHLDGTPIAIDTSALLLATLRETGFVDPSRVFIQSFELYNLLRLATELLPAAGLKIPLVQLLGNTDPADARAHDGFSQPWDLVFHAANGADLAALYAGLGTALGAPLDRRIGYAQLTSPAALAWMRARYAAGVGPWISNIVPRTGLPGADPNANAAQTQLTGRATTLIADARAAGLLVHPYTLRAEARFAALDRHGQVQSVDAAARQLLDLGANGWFTDQPDLGVAARDAWLDAKARAAPQPR